MKKYILHVLLLIAVCGGSFSIAHGASLVAGRTSAWTSEIYVYNATAPITFMLTDCRGFGPLPTYTLKAGQATKAEPYLCFSGPGVVDAPDGAESMSRLTYDDGTTRASFIVPSLDYLTSASVVPVANSSPLGTWVNAYTTVGTTITVSVDGPDGVEVGREVFTAGIGWTQYRLTTAVNVGTLRLTTGCIGFGPCSANPFLGFVSVSDESGGNAQVIPLR